MSGEGQGSTPEGFVKDAFRFCWDPLTNCLRNQEMFPAALDQAMDAYKQETGFLTIRSDKDSHFTTAIVQNAKEDENLTGLASNKIRIKRIKCQSDQNLDWTIYLWKTDGFEDTDLDLDSFSGRYVFTNSNGEQLAGANQYYYDSGPIDVIVEDLDGTFESHCSLVNRSAVSKIAGATGEFILELEYETAF